MRPRTALPARDRALYSRLRQLLREPGLLRGNLVEMRRQCVFAVFVVRLRSFRALEQALRRLPGWRAWLGPGRLPSADTLGRALAGTALPALRALVLTR